MQIMCDSYCTHGGRCTKEPGHAGDHDTDYCTWTDAEALTREQADEVMGRTQQGRDFLNTFQPLADLMEIMMDEED